MADKVKLGIIGYGHIGSQHGRAIRDGKCPQVNLTAVCDIDPARLELAKKTNGEDIQTFTDASELIHSGACEAVIIAVPHYLHPSMAIEAMETGLHVIVEKPAGVYTKQVEEMNAVAAKHPELVYCMDFNQRTNPLYKKVKDLIDSGDLGEMTRVIWIVTDWYRSQSYYRCRNRSANRPQKPQPPSCRMTRNWRWTNIPCRTRCLPRMIWKSAVTWTVTFYPSPKSEPMS